MRRACLAAAAAAAAILAVPERADASVQWVRGEKQFHAAVARAKNSGGTIVLLPARYRRLVLCPRSMRWLRITGRRRVRVERIVLDGARRVSIGRLTIAPRTRTAAIHVNRDSRHVDLHHLRVTAQGTRLTARVVIREGFDVTVRRSEFTHCGDRYPYMTNCLQIRKWSRGIRVTNNWFHDCFGCDFVHGRFGSDLLIRGNRFERALPCNGNSWRCGHQDLIELFAGRRLRVERNHFGVYHIGGAQLYITGPVDHVNIVNNVFRGSDPRVPGVRARMGIIVGSKWSRRLPHYVKIVNNTLLTGDLRRDGYSGSLRVSSRYGLVPRRKRPIVINNVIGIFETPLHVCAATRAFIRNVILHGYPCSASDRVGSAALDGSGRPTAASTLLIDQGSRAYAPARDASGRRRRARPDIGAFEYHGAR